MTPAPLVLPALRRRARAYQEAARMLNRGVAFGGYGRRLAAVAQREIGDIIRAEIIPELRRMADVLTSSGWARPAKVRRRKSPERQSGDVSGFITGFEAAVAKHEGERRPPKAAGRRGPKGRARR